MPGTTRLLTAAALLLCLTSCTGGPGPVPSAGTSPPALSDQQLSDVEHQLVQDVIADGHDPAGPPVLTYRSGQDVDAIWPTTDGYLCVGKRNAMGRLRFCLTDPFPAAPAPHLEIADGPTPTRDGFVTVFLAGGEDVRDLTCGGARAALRRVGRFRARATDLAVYTYVTPWVPHGILQAEVVRAGVPATEQVTLDSFDIRRDWVRMCGSDPLPHP
ncbi:hypothetical protein ACFV4F_06295 [Kitasatospora sp. NPDC059722]|uniref:hypothetical protein n=1 Tax=Kitasatospora sp. NPDC059722 TaxID=3346925 RepID=UPI0036B6FEA6